MQFGFTLKPEHTLERTLALTRQAEEAGFDSVVATSKYFSYGTAEAVRSFGRAKSRRLQ